MDDGRRILEEILKRENRPDAIIAGSDEVAAGILTEAMNQGIKVPEDLAIVGVDDPADDDSATSAGRRNARSKRDYQAAFRGTR